jgi:cobalt/nickel transport system permease protein
MTRDRRILVVLAGAACLSLLPATAWAMHISEGILPAGWAIGWFIFALPFVAWGVRDIRRQSRENSYYKSLAGLMGAAVFVISCLPIPVPGTGSCAHPTGAGLAAIFIGPAPTVVISGIALGLQALFMSHGGLSTLGANILSMGIGGAFAGYYIFRLCRGLGLPAWGAAFAAGLLSDWTTYTLTSLELASALADPANFLRMLATILLAFVPTQVPLGILEGFISAGAYSFLLSRRPDLIPVLKREAA